MLITIFAMMMYVFFFEQGHESFMTFGPSNPIHVMMVSSAREAAGQHGKPQDHLEDCLAGFERSRVKFEGAIAQYQY